MPLRNDLETARDRAFEELRVAHDYYSDTKIAWQVVEESVAAGRRFTITNAATGTITDQTQITTKARGYITRQLAEATFQTFLSVFETFLGDFLRAWLRAYPMALLPTEDVPFETILTAADKAAVIDFVVDRKVYGLFYERPAEWFRYVERKVKLGCPTADEIGRLAEAKATRDVLVHNRGIASPTYVDKAGAFARVKAGDPIDIPGPYH